MIIRACATKLLSAAVAAGALTGMFEATQRTFVPVGRPQSQLRTDLANPGNRAVLTRLDREGSHIRSRTWARRGAACSTSSCTSFRDDDPFVSFDAAISSREIVDRDLVRILPLLWESTRRLSLKAVDTVCIACDSLRRAE